MSLNHILTDLNGILGDTSSNPVLPKATDRLLRLGDVEEITAISRSEIYRRMARGEFPRQKRLSHKVARWMLSDIEKWMDENVRTH